MLSASVPGFLCQWTAKLFTAILVNVFINGIQFFLPTRLCFQFWTHLWIGFVHSPSPGDLISGTCRCVLFSWLITLCSDATHKDDRSVCYEKLLRFILMLIFRVQVYNYMRACVYVYMCVCVFVCLFAASYWSFSKDQADNHGFYIQQKKRFRCLQIICARLLGNCYMKIRTAFIQYFPNLALSGRSILTEG